MSRYFTEENSAETVISRLESCPDPRFRQVMESAVRHLHAFVKEVEPSLEEWRQAIDFLTATGQKCDDRRHSAAEWILLSDTQEWILLSDTLASRPYPFHRDGAGPCAGGDPHLRARRSLHRFGCGLRGQGVADRALRARGGPRPGPRVRRSLGVVDREVRLHPGIRRVAPRFRLAAASAGAERRTPRSRRRCRRGSAGPWRARSSSPR